MQRSFGREESLAKECKAHHYAGIAKGAVDSLPKVPKKSSVIPNAGLGSDNNVIGPFRQPAEFIAVFLHCFCRCGVHPAHEVHLLHEQLTPT